jgi:cyclophilin family peptidyl-prolyl cis-trans isomerase
MSHLSHRARRAHLVVPIVAAAVLALTHPLAAQRTSLARADSDLIARVLVAEDRRDASDEAIAAALRHRDERVRAIAQRARGRIRDSLFASRDSIPPVVAPPALVVWPEPTWRLRYRELAAKRNDCGALNAALDDSAWHVRLRAVDLAPVTCRLDPAFMSTIKRWIDSLPADASHRRPGGVSWQAAAHALVALARIRHDSARARIALLAIHPQWEVRAYAARAAAVVGDTARLRALATDADDNVKEAAITALSKITHHADDDIYIAALASDGAQAVRAAAIALDSSPRPDVRLAANAMFAKWVARQIASARDARLALLAAAGRPASDDRPPPSEYAAPPRLVDLALGADVRLRVTLAPESGGGSFVVRLRGDVAPMMAARVLALAKSGYYDGQVWQRVEPDFVVQGGGPGANEYVGYDQYLRDELGTVPQLRGTVGMSTRGHDTGDAQWFFNLRDNQRLDRDYTLFADVVSGMDVVDGIMEGDMIQSIVEEPSGGGR